MTLKCKYPVTTFLHLMGFVLDRNFCPCTLLYFFSLRVAAQQNFFRYYAGQMAMSQETVLLTYFCYFCLLFLFLQCLPMSNMQHDMLWVPLLIVLVLSFIRFVGMEEGLSTNVE